MVKDQQKATDRKAHNDERGLVDRRVETQLHRCVGNIRKGLSEYKGIYHLIKFDSYTYSDYAMTFAITMGHLTSAQH